MAHAVVLALVSVGAAARTCFQDAVLQRANITFDGIDMPIGVWQNAWDSSGIISQIYSIIATEKLGFNIHVETGPASELILGKLAGCAHQGFAITGMACDSALLHLCVYIYICSPPPRAHLSASGVKSDNS